MNAARLALLECVGACLLALAFEACGDLKPNTGGDAALDASGGKDGTGTQRARDAGGALELDGGAADSTGAENPVANGGGTAGAGGSAVEGVEGMGLGARDAGLDGGATTGSGSSPDAATSLTVHGRIVDAWNLPLAGVALSVGAQLLVTDAAGEFTANDVQAPYDVDFEVSEITAGGNTRVTDGWSFQGLTRSDPTFWASRAGTIWSGNAVFSVTGTSTPTPSIALGIGLPSGRTGGSDTLPLPGATIGFSWSGASQSSGVAHALTFATDSTASRLPSEYQGYFSVPITGDGTINFGNSYTLDLTAPSPPIASHQLSGDVAGDRIQPDNQVWLSFPDHAALMLAEENPASATFSYLVPEIAGATVTVYASAGQLSTGSLAFAHRSRDATSADDSRLEIVLPNPPAPLEPLPGETLTLDTVFRWQTDNAVSVLTLLEDTATFTHRIHVVTAAKNAQIPSRLSSSLLEAGDATWIVEAYGLATSLDAVTSATGSLDPFADEMSGPIGGDGSYSASSGQMLVVPASP